MRLAALCAVLILMTGMAAAAPYAAMVIDERSGEILHARNHDTRLHPASLTKMMTLYIAFDAVRRGEIGLDTEVRISRNAAAEPPSKLGLRAGQRIKLRYLIRAAAVKSANDAATAIGEAIAGSEDAFARRMNRTARALGMNHTTFKNAHGLTMSGHLSTARDMTTLGMRLFRDHPAYYNIFSRRSTDAGVTQVRNTNRRLLDAYRGADGIKTGYTRAAGFNLVASAERDGTRIIATVFGGRSTATRNKRVMELLDMGFERAESGERDAAPEAAADVVATATIGPRAPAASMRPRMRPGGAPADDLVIASASTPETGPMRQVVWAASAAPQPETRAMAAVDGATIVERVVAQRPTMRPGEDGPLRVVTTDAPNRDYGIVLGKRRTRSDADKLLLTAAMRELETLDGTIRGLQVVQGGWRPSFLGLSLTEAQRACQRLAARDMDCEVMRGA
nr:D-alanyl-D-alanine carboxypeptidase family protein [Jannaschia sp. Os4]